MPFCMNRSCGMHSSLTLFSYLPTYLPLLLFIYLYSVKDSFDDTYLCWRMTRYRHRPTSHRFYRRVDALYWHSNSSGIIKFVGQRKRRPLPPSPAYRSVKDCDDDNYHCNTDDYWHHNYDDITVNDNWIANDGLVESGNGRKRRWSFQRRWRRRRVRSVDRGPRRYRGVTWIDRVVGGWHGKQFHRTRYRFKSTNVLVFNHSPQVWLDYVSRCATWNQSEIFTFYDHLC